jgi:hypothetical protein
MVNGASMNQTDRPTAGASEATWAVYRQDDNGNKFRMATGLSQEDAAKMVSVFEARGHKQVYWAEPEQYSDDVIR